MRHKSMSFRRLSGVLLVIAIAALLGGAPLWAANVKTLGRLNVPSNDQVMAICTDPVVQSVLNDALHVQKRSGSMMVVTVTVTSQVLAPGASIQNIAPGDPSVADILKSMGAEPLPLGDSGNQAPDPYSIAAQRQGTMPEDRLTSQFRNYQAFRQSTTSAAPSPYDNLPANQVYQTAVVARATAQGSENELKVVVLAEPGDDLDAAKKLAAVEIANAILH